MRANILYANILWIKEISSENFLSSKIYILDLFFVRK